MTYLEQLPDHHGFQNCADASRSDNEGIGGEHEMMQSSEKRSMLECLRHKGIDILFEWQLNTDADRSARPGNAGRSFVGCLHQPRTTTGDDVAAQLREGGCHRLVSS